MQEGVARELVGVAARGGWSAATNGSTTGNRRKSERQVVRLQY
jgi:hypothetical protein